MMSCRHHGNTIGGHVERAAVLLLDRTSRHFGRRVRLLVMRFVWHARPLFNTQLQLLLLSGGGGGGGLARDDDCSARCGQVAAAAAWGKHGGRFEGA